MLYLVIMLSATLSTLILIAPTMQACKTSSIPVYNFELLKNILISFLLKSSLVKLGCPSFCQSLLIPQVLSVGPSRREGYFIKSRSQFLVKWFWLPAKKENVQPCWSRLPWPNAGQKKIACKLKLFLCLSK